jgi:hypothetical protein
MAFTEAERAAVTAALVSGDRGAQAIRRFLETVDFEVAGAGIWRLAPLLHRRAVEHGIRHPLVPRLGGVSRHIWLGNEVRIRALPALLVVAQPMTPVVLINAMATLARLGEGLDLRPLGPIEVLVSPRRAYGVVSALKAAGWQAPPCEPDPMSEDSASWHAVPVGQDGMQHFVVHRHLFHDMLDRDFSEGIITHANAVPFRDRPVLVPSVENHVLMLLTQAQHPGSERRVDWALDAALSLSQSAGVIDWHRFHGVADKYGLTPRIEIAAVVLRDQLDIAIPRALIERVSPRPRRGRLSGLR